MWGVEVRIEKTDTTFLFPLQTGVTRLKILSATVGLPAPLNSSGKGTQENSDSFLLLWCTVVSERGRPGNLEKTAWCSVH